MDAANAFRPNEAGALALLSDRDDGEDRGHQRGGEAAAGAVCAPAAAGNG